MRAFLALPVDDDAVAAMLRLQGQLPFGKPVPEDNLHLTLAFLGDVAEGTLHDIHALLDGLLLPAPQVTFTKLGTFAEMERGLVYAEVAPDQALSTLQNKVARIARQAGAELPRKRFRPHVTLMRANKQPKGPARDRLAHALGAPINVPGYLATTLCLYQSELTPNGARHEVMAAYPLG